MAPAAAAGQNIVMKEKKCVDYYNEVARQLYNQALYTLGDKALARQTAIGAYCDTYERFGGAADARLCHKYCMKRLYRRGRSAWRKHRKAGSASHDLIGLGSMVTPLSALLDGLSFSGRFMLLLFCCYKYSIHEIADTMDLPVFFVNRRLVAASRMIAERQAQS